MQLSYSALSVFKDCRRCFWLDRNKKLSRPRGIFSSLPTGIDGLLKEQLEPFRGSLPPTLQGYTQLEGFQLYVGADLAKMRNWKTNPLKMTDSKGNVIVGAFDDLLYNPETKEYAFLDYKTVGKEVGQEYPEKYYQSQVNIYTRFLELGKKKVASFGVFFYFWPVKSEIGLIEFKSKPFFLTPDTVAAEKLFSEAMECLNGPKPDPSNDCQYCDYHEKLKKED